MRRFPRKSFGKSNDRGSRKKSRRWRHQQPQRGSSTGGTAAVLSAIVPGLGLLYAGQIGLGLLVMILFPVLAGYGSLMALAGGDSALLAGLVVVGAWVAQIYMAYAAGER